MSATTEAASGAPLAAGETIAPGYEVLGHLGRGSSLDTYDAWSEARACRCVIKALRPDRRANPRSRRRLRREGRLACELNHPHLVRGYELIVRPDPVAVLETIDGETLEHMLATRQQRLSRFEIVHLGLHLCSAMHYLHASGHVHLDLKPSNIISECGRAKVIDLSLARRPGPGRRGIGTPGYMAPEQVRGGLVCPATDVWGIGVVLHEAGAGRAPFEGLNGTRYPQLEHRAPALRELRRLPPGLAAAVDACLEPEAGRRPTVPELSAALGEFA